VTVPIHGLNFNDILGSQFTLQTPGLTFTGVEAGALDVRMENIGVHAGSVTLSWSSAVPLSTSEILFTLIFKADRGGSLHDLVSIGTGSGLWTPAEAYDVNESPMNVSFGFRKVSTIHGMEFAVYQNEPNPFAEKTVIGFMLPESMSATLTVFDIVGNHVWTTTRSFVAGLNRIEVSRKELAPGLLYYRLDAGEFSATKKMILQE
jgi:hypothetical protein